MIHDRLAAAAILAAMLWAGACSSAAAPGEESAAGPAGDPRVVDNDAPRWAGPDGWRVDPEPTVTIGVDEGEAEYQLHFVRDARRLADGRIVISNLGTHQLRFYAADGRHIRDVGRGGQGPGEFGEFSGMLIWPYDGDLLVDDRANGRVNSYSTDGEYRDLIQTPEFSGSASIAGFFTDGSALIWSSPNPRLNGDVADVVLRLRHEFHRGGLDPDAERVFLFGGDARARWVNRVGTITHFPYIPFSPDLVAVAGGDHLIAAVTGEPEFQRIAADGSVVARVRWNAPERVPVASIWERYVSATLDEIGNPEQRERFVVLFGKDLPLPELVPAFDEVQVDDEDCVWVRRYLLPWDTDATWDVFGPDGVWQSSVTLDRSFRLHHVGRDFILGRDVSESGVEQVRLYELDRRDAI